MRDELCQDGGVVFFAPMQSPLICSMKGHGQVRRTVRWPSASHIKKPAAIISRRVI